MTTTRLLDDPRAALPTDTAPRRSPRPVLQLSWVPTAEELRMRWRAVVPSGPGADRDAAA